MSAMQSLLENGDQFIYAGLKNDPLDKDFVRHITVVGISVDGMLQYRLEIQTEEGDRHPDWKQPSLGSVDYRLALTLVEQGVWLQPDDYATKKRLGKFKLT